MNETMIDDVINHVHGHSWIKVVQEVVVPKVTAGILEIEGVMSNTK